MASVGTAPSCAPGEFDRSVAEGFIRPEHRRLVLAAADPSAVLDVLAAWDPPPPTRKWVDGAVSAHPRRH